MPGSNTIAETETNTPNIQDVVIPVSPDFREETLQDFAGSIEWC
jgi:hypothetical protein